LFYSEFSKTVKIRGHSKYDQLFYLVGWLVGWGLTVFSAQLGYIMPVILFHLRLCQLGVHCTVSVDACTFAWYVWDLKCNNKL